MSLKSAAQAIRDTVSMDQIVDLYGYRTRHGFMCCPFHGEREPSLKVYPETGGWHCFGCGRGGSVIDFVMEHEHCDFRTAIIAIDKALHLGLMDPHENPFEANRDRELQLALDQFVTAANAVCDAKIREITYRQIAEYHQHQRVMDRLSQDNPKRKSIQREWKERDEYMDYQISKWDEFREGVAAWRRKLRRKT